MPADIEAAKDLPYGQPERKRLAKSWVFLFCLAL